MYVFYFSNIETSVFMQKNKELKQKIIDLSWIESQVSRS